MLPPLAVYVHLPWCVRKCPYCDFNSHAAPAALPEDAYVEALLGDLRSDLDLAAGRRAESVFIGGGTPSLFSPAAIGRLLAGVRAELALAPGAEVTLEANPGTIERGRFEGYAEAGVNRVSLGAQSFSTGQLQSLGRIHSPSDIEAAVADLRRAGLDNFNLDLMYALPEQDLAGAQADLERALALEPAHLSHYQLTLEPGTAFYHRPPPLPDDDLALDMQLACQARIAEAGLGQYEVSAYARAGRRCRHNLAYWRFEDYLGLGAGAHGKATTAGGVIRTERLRMPREYLARAAAGAAGTRRTVPAAELPFEFMLNALRLLEGFTLGDFEQGTGVPASAVAPTLESLGRRGLVERAGDRYRPSSLGFRFLNDLQAAFLPEPADGHPRVA
ncbi:MAG: radical SAM family heme chaperone HemW [Steroidobacteraceae bacterium]|jgi:oxygen-independent coproporphyrinogen-3 oxidase|nr:radical SAM family heme chaperone HemW [Steroidobacteraceae bacterium]